jgi:hypothetical protein
MTVDSDSQIHDQVAARPVDELVAHQLTRAEILRQGTAALERLAAAEAWVDWVLVLRALDIGRAMAMADAKTNKPRGRRYAIAFGKWLRLHPEFERIDKSDRVRFHECFTNLDTITAWRESLPTERKLKLNYPPTVLAHWKRSLKSPKSTNKSTTETDSNLVTAFVEIWNKMCDAERIQGQARILSDLPLGKLLQAMPREYLVQLEGRAGKQVLSQLKTRHPNTKAKQLKATHLRVAFDADAPTAPAH